MTAGGEGKRLLAVVAHPDDESFGCGSLLLHAAARGVTTAVCCATSGEAGDPAPGSGLTRDDLATVRPRELEEAARLLGVGRLDLLRYGDSGMTGSTGTGTLCAAAPEDVQRDVQAVVEDFRPHVVVTLDASDGHRDHVRVRDIAVAAVEASSWTVGRVYLQCLARSLMHRWLAHASGTDSYVGDLGTPDHLITTVIDTASHLSQRDLAMAAHASQTSPYAGLPDDLRREFLCVERLLRVRPAWSGDQLERDIFPSLAAAL